MSSGRPYEEHYGVPRLNWESDHEWRCRTIFLDINKQFYKGDRLASYSMSWSNWKFMGNIYNPEVQGLYIIINVYSIFCTKCLPYLL